ncbi:hypothetical protein A3715_18130 [Oleiphilus sp. HI0009]|nr:hypothetical protein A3715_18130 [Oleiphilus sp. HI0009]
MRTNDSVIPLSIAAIALFVFAASFFFISYSYFSKTSEIQSLQAENNRLISLLENHQKQTDNRLISFQKRLENIKSISSSIVSSLSLHDQIDDTPAYGGHFTESFPSMSNSFQNSLSSIDSQLESELKFLKSIDLLNIKKPSDFIGGLPLKGYVTSPFGKRLDPFLGKWMDHFGVDIAAPVGSNVYSTGVGLVSFAGTKGGFGTTVEIQHDAGFLTRYTHLSDIHVSIGDRVEKQQIIGEVGMTGRTNGPHLHYEVLHNDVHLDPKYFLSRF